MLVLMLIFVPGCAPADKLPASTGKSAKEPPAAAANKTDTAGDVQKTSKPAPIKKTETVKTNQAKSKPVPLNSDAAPVFVADTLPGGGEDDPDTDSDTVEEEAKVKQIELREPPPGKMAVRFPPPDAKRFPGLTRLSKDFDVWVDLKQRRVILQGEVCLREGQLELFACLHQWVQSDDPKQKDVKVRRGSKEHEAVITINTSAMLVHTALLLAKAKPGSPVKFRPKYVPASGTEIDIELQWLDPAGKLKKSKAQEWIRNLKTRKAMTHPWVFAGSGFWVDDKTGEKHYRAESGDLICVSNFDTAVLDLPILSSQTNDQLLFEPFTENIPKGRLGLVAETKDGKVKIAKITPDSSADRVGLKVGDVIHKVEYKDVADLKHFNKVLGEINPGRHILMRIERDGKIFDTRTPMDGVVVTLVLTPKPAEKKAVEKKKE
jgi:hypothetical protein